MKGLQATASSKPIQDRLYVGDAADALLGELYEASSRYAAVNGVSIIDENNKVVNAHLGKNNLPSIIGRDASEFSTYSETKANLPDPTFSRGFPSPFDGMQLLALSYPIYNYESRDYMGSVNIVIDTHSFLTKYGNLEDINSQYIGFLDRNWTILGSPFKDSLGRNYHDPVLAQASNEQADAHFEKVLSGQSSVALFSYRTGDRLNAGEPIVLQGDPTYFLFIVTPTDAIYSEIDSVIAAQRIVFYVLQGAIVGAIALALYFLMKWSASLEKAVIDRTGELEIAVAQLKVHDKLQKEFINMAAHELRTPIAPILLMTSKQEFDSPAGDVRMPKEDFEIIVRNAEKLRRLADSLLDAARIERGSLELKLEDFDLDDLISPIIHEFQSGLPNGKTIIQYVGKKVSVTADRERIAQVISNLISNATKFTERGTITVEVSSNHDEVIVSVRDTGRGIDPDLIPRLFTKFGTKSDSGTGLGLFISKKIIEAHGGWIRGENNNPGPGASFSFSLPRVENAV